MKKYSLLTLVLMSCHSFAAPVFSVTPNVTGQATLVQGQQGSYIYQITNNTKNNLSNIGLLNLPAGVSIASSGYGFQYCSFPLTLDSNASCLFKLNVNSNQTPASVNGGPKVCFRSDKPIYCSQPPNANQLATSILPGPLSTSCWDNVGNFNDVLTQNFDTGSVDQWGPAPAVFTMSSSNPNLTGCAASAGTGWSQQRILDAIDFWIQQKLNYCHHHVPDYATPVVNFGTPRASIPGSAGGYCSTFTDLKPGTPYYGQEVRWNYSGTGSETKENWLNNNYQWFGVDCSDFTKFYYNFALSGANLSTFTAPFNSDTGYQAGQSTGGTQDTLTPNEQQSLNSYLGNYSNSTAAGTILCADGSLEQISSIPPTCGAGANPYMSVFDNTGHRTLTITDTMLGYLQPGDLLFVAPPSNSDGAATSSIITHVITWTSKKVGNGPNDIPASRIAPNEECPNDWQPQTGDWVIADSHYQGPDYRVYNGCGFYVDNIWGVRRVIQ